MKQLQEILKPYFAEGQTDYDITAVLKYIVDISKYSIIDGRDEITSEKIKFYKTNFGDKGLDLMRGEIPNKPLHLYDATEEYNLLELLKKLGL